MPTLQTLADAAEADIIDGELHPDSRLRYIQRRMQDDEGLRLSIDSISYMLRMNEEFDRVHGLT